MPKSEKIGHYPIQYFDIFNKAIADGTIEIPCTDKAQGKALQFDLYGFRRAVGLRDEEEALPLQTVTLKVQMQLDERYVLLMTTENKFVDMLDMVLGHKEKIVTPVADLAIKPTEQRDYIPGVTAPPIAPAAEEDTNEQSCYKKFMQPANNGGEKESS